jgi:hypothetical protein
VVAAIPATPYPDERYRTKVLWWNRHDFFNYAQPDQVAKILTETELLLRALHRRGGVDALFSEWSSITRGKPPRTTHFEVVA